MPMLQMSAGGPAQVFSLMISLLDDQYSGSGRRQLVREGTYGACQPLVPHIPFMLLSPTMQVWPKSVMTTR